MGSIIMAKRFSHAKSVTKKAEPQIEEATFAEKSRMAWELIRNGEASNLKEAWEIIKSNKSK